MAVQLLTLLVLQVLFSSVWSQSYPIVCNSDEEACIQYPSDCSQSLYRPSTCQYIATWKPVPGGFEIELGGQVGNEKGYVALGFSYDDKMGDDFVVACHKSSTKSDVDITASYNTPLPERKNIFVRQDVIKDKKSYYKNFMKDSKWDSAIVECKFTLLTSSGSVGSSDHSKMGMLIDKLDPEVYLLAARGTGEPIYNDGLSHHQWVNSFQKRKLSAKGIAGKSEHGLAKAHGCMMVLAWVLCASVGIILARYYKLQWPTHKLGREDVWFQMHRGLMVSCVILTALSFIIIFIDLRGYSSRSNFPDYLHPILGIIVMILSIVNPIISLFRCKQDDKDRPWFNWIHWLVGTVAYILAIFNLFLGLRLERAADFNRIDFHIWILILFVLFQFIIEIILEIHTLYHWKRNKKRWQKFHEEMGDYQQAKTAMLQPRARPEEPRPAGFCMRTFLLILHAVIAAAVAFILFIVIIVY